MFCTKRETLDMRFGGGRMKEKAEINKIIIYFSRSWPNGHLRGKIKEDSNGNF
jgi:hypothetical protein